MEENLEIEFPPDDELPLSHCLAVRSRPLLWIKKFALYENWKPNSDNLIRDFTLRRGLNILWADPAGETENSTNRLSGHSAGKSTFCRLIRYLLTEKPAGTDDFVKGFRARFPGGWILGEIIIDGQGWLIGRPLSGSSGHQSFAFPNQDLSFEFPDTPPRKGWADYKEALSQATFGKAPDRKLPDTEKDLDWKRLLPWLSRDQEAHYSGLLAWRHPDSNHDSPKVSASDRSHIVRLVMGVLGDTEQRLLEKLSTVSRDHETKIRNRPAEIRVYEEDQKRLEAVLGHPIAEDAPEQLALKIGNLGSEEKISIDSTEVEQRHEEELADLQSTLDDARLAKTMAEGIRDSVQADLELDEARLTGSKPTKVTPKAAVVDPIQAQLNKFGPFPGFCSVKKADAKRCEAYQERHLGEESQKAVKSIEGETKEITSRIPFLKTRVAALQLNCVETEKAFRDSQKKIRDLRKAHQTELQELKRPETDAEELATLRSSFASSKVNLETWDRDIEALEKKKEGLNSALSKASKDHQGRLKETEIIFNRLAQRLLGKEVHGTVRFKGRSIEPELHFRGKRNSAALKVAKWLIFDLTALIFSMRNATSLHPRFLIHDSPREADLARIIYSELFQIAAELEGESEAAFQYIITTTEPPPEELQNEPWLLKPVLNSATEAGRLLGVNLDSQAQTGE